MKDYSKLSQVSLQVQKDYQADAGRIERASRIVQNHEVNEVAGSNHTRYTVQSQSRKANYIVDYPTVTCGCVDAQNENVCKHFLSVAIYRALPDVTQSVSFDEFLAQFSKKAEMQKVVEA